MCAIDFNLLLLLTERRSHCEGFVRDRPEEAVAGYDLPTAHPLQGD